MRIDPQIKRLKIGLDHLRDYDLLPRTKPEKKIISVHLPVEIVHRMENIENRSRFIEAAIEEKLAKQEF